MRLSLRAAHDKEQRRKVFGHPNSPSYCRRSNIRIREDAFSASVELSVSSNPAMNFLKIRFQALVHRKESIIN